MKNLIFSTIVCLGMVSAIAQVGIGNTSPNATLDITASNAATPSNDDGLLIPRIDEFPATDPVAASDGLMVFATGNGSVSKGFYYWDEGATSWTIFNGANAINELSDGISDSDGSNNGSSVFLGLNAGITDNGTDNRSVGIGFEALRLNTNGRDNIGIGNQALRNNTNGFSNIAIGTGTLFTTTGNGNIAIGFNALNDNTTASDNIGIGFASLENNSTGVNNVAVGSQTLSNNTLGFFNNAFGRHSLQSNIDGNGNTAMGHGSLRDNTSGSNNAAFGNSAGDNVNGENNVFIGRGAGVGPSGSTNSGNVVIGNEAGSGINYNNRLYIDNSNTSTPLIYGEFDNDILRINGTLDINNQYQLPTTDGAANQVLQTDGAGNLSWIDPPTPNNGVAAKFGTSNNSTLIQFTETNLIFNSLVYNYGGGAYNTGTGTYTVPSDGVYNVQVKLNMNFVSSINKECVMAIRLYVNGSLREQMTHQDGSTYNSGWPQGFMYEFNQFLSAGNLVTLRMLPEWGGSTPAPFISGSQSSFTIHKVF